MLESLDRAKEKVESGEIDALVISGCGDETGFRQLYGNNFAVIGLAKTLYDKALKAYGYRWFYLGKEGDEICSN